MEEIQEKEEMISIRDLFEIFRANILFFAISIAAAIVLAIFYLAATPPTYTRSATILIKDEQDGKSIGGGAIMSMESLGLLQSKTNINNELTVLRTPTFMFEVVRRLDLNYNYKVKSNPLRWSDLYNTTPFKVELDELLLGSSVSFKVEFKSDSQFRITDLVVDLEEYNSAIEGNFESGATTPYGKILLSKTPFFNEESLGTNYKFGYSSVKKVADNYLKALSISLQDKDATVINLTIENEVPQRADNLLNTLISVYNENWIKDKNEVTLNTNAFIEDRLLIIEQELGIVDGDISSFKSENLVPDLATAANMQMMESSENRSQQLALENQLSMAKYIHDYLKDPAKADQLIPAGTGIESGAIESEIGNYNESFLQRNILLANSGPRNPLVVDLNEQLIAIREVITRSIDDLINTLSIQISNAQQVEKTNKELLAKSPNQAKELINIERQQKVKEALYLYLLQKREENELSQAFTAYNTKIISMADGSEFPTAPRKLIILILAIMIGGAIPVAYLFLMFTLDTFVKDKSDLKGLDIPYIGSLPHIGENEKRIFGHKRSKRRTHAEKMIVLDNSRDIANEAFRVVRTNLDFMLGKKHQCPVIQTISLNPSSGKSMISANLSSSMSLKGNAKVIVIDCDMRRYALSEYVNNPSVGLSNYLNDYVSNIDDIILKGKITDTLDIIPSGTVPPNPSELLLTDRFAVLIEELKKRYDYIFLDCPPVEIVPDSAIVGKYCDISIFVVRAGLFDKRYLPEIDVIRNSGKYANMCILLNDVGYSSSRYGYGYGYGSYGYGYGSYGYGSYGYGSYGNETDKKGKKKKNK